jgi:hypothetical protein
MALEPKKLCLGIEVVVSIHQKMLRALVIISLP